MIIRSYILFIYLLFLFFTVSAHDNCSDCALTFIENKGQWHKNVLYKSDLHSGTFFMEEDAFTFTLYDPHQLAAVHGHASHKDRQVHKDERHYLDYHAYQVKFLGDVSIHDISTSSPTQGYYNYFSGKDPGKWASRLKGFRQLIVNDLYPGIDLKIYSSHANFKYDLIVEPGKDPSQIKMLYKGVKGLSLNENGDLIIPASVNSVTELKPYAYQIIEGKEVPVECRFSLNRNVVRFIFPDGYNHNLPLIIDPVLVFATFSGSTADNWGYTATYDEDRNGYAGGSVFNSGYPVDEGIYDAAQDTFTGGPGGLYSVTDIGISKYDTSGGLIYATYLGGYGGDRAYSLVVNNNDELLVLGSTASSDFPVTPSAYDTTYNGSWDIFISRLSKNGDNLLSSTYIGGSSSDGINISQSFSNATSLKYNYGDDARGEIITDEFNNIYVAITTQSSDFPTTANAYQKKFGGSQDGCVFKMDISLSSLVWSTFIGGTEDDACYSLKLNSNNESFITGGTRSAYFFPDNTTYSNTYSGGRADGFIVNLDKNGSSVINATYIGSDLYDQTYFIDLDNDEQVYVIGQTAKTDGTFVLNANYSEANSGQFVSKFNSSLDTMIMSTTFGSGSGQPDISPSAFLVDVCEKIYISGWGGGTNSNGGDTYGLTVTSNAYQSSTDGSDFYLIVLDKNADTVVYATYFGLQSINEHVDGGTSRFDKRGAVYQSICGSCGSSNTSRDSTITTPGAFSRADRSGNCNNLIFNFDFEFPILNADFDMDPSSGCSPLTVDFTNMTTNGADYFWDFDDGDTSDQKDPVHTFTQSGTYNVKLIANNILSCNVWDTITKQVVVFSDTSNTLPNDTLCGPGSVQFTSVPALDTPATYTWKPSLFLNDPAIANPTATPDSSMEYILFLSNGTCTDTFYKKIVVINAAGIPDRAMCLGDTIKIGFNPEDSTTYNWTPSYGLSDTTVSNPKVFPDSTTTYFLTMTTPYCQHSDSVKVTVDIPDFEANAGPDTGLCSSDTIMLGDTLVPGLVYSWQPDTFFISKTNISNPLIYPLRTTKYFVTVSNGGCTRTDSVLIEISDSAEVSAGPDQSLCSNEKVQIGSLNPDAESSWKYRWTPDIELSSDTVAMPYASPDSNMTYYVTLNNGGCIDRDTVNLTVLESSSSSSFDFTTEYDCRQVTINYSNLSAGAESYIWRFGNGDSSNEVSPSYTITDPADTVFTMLITIDESGCRDTMFQVFDPASTDDLFSLKFPNVFTPNNDGHNDCYQPVQIKTAKNCFHLQVFNRWGETLYETDDPEACWDGTIQSSDEQADEGTYFYIIDVMNTAFTGYLQIIR